jgi:hypothetical protein
MTEALPKENAAQIIAAGYEVYLETIFKKLGAQKISYSHLNSNGHSRPEIFSCLGDFIRESKIFELEEPDLIVYKKAPTGMSPSNCRSRHALGDGEGFLCGLQYDLLPRHTVSPERVLLSSAAGPGY